MFTMITITGGPFLRPDGQPAQGAVTATLSEPMVNGSERIDPTPVAGILNAAGMLCDDSGELPFALEATTDPETLPVGAVYAFVLELDSAPIDPFSAPLPHDAPGATVDLNTLAL